MNAQNFLSEKNLQMLFELHHRQLNETQMQIQSITEKGSALILLLTGWVVLSDSTPNIELKVVLALGIIVFSISASLLLIGHANGRRRIALVVDRINNQLGLFSESESGESLYPSHWKNFGQRSIFEIVGSHIFTILVVAIFAIVAVSIK